LRYEFTPENDRETLCLRRHLCAIGEPQLLYTEDQYRYVAYMDRRIRKHHVRRGNEN
jgi:hypothetical protein